MARTATSTCTSRIGSPARTARAEPLARRAAGGATSPGRSAAPRVARSEDDYTIRELDEPPTEVQLRVRAPDPELVWLSHEHEAWRPPRRLRRHAGALSAVE